MSQMTYRQIVQEAGAMLDLDVTAGSEEDTSLKRYVNIFGRRLWASRPWRERRAEAVVSTVAPYTTGTVTVVAGDATLEGSGTTWTGFEGRKFGLALNAPFYRIATVTDADTVELARNYLESSDTGLDYVIYQDEYNLGTSVDALVSVTLLYNSRWGDVRVIPETTMDLEVAVGNQSGRPVVASVVTSTTTGNRRMRVSPVPDAEYALVVKYLKAWTDLSGDSDVPVLPQNAEYLLLMGTVLLGQRISNVAPKTSEQEMESLIQRLWRDQQDDSMVVQRKTVDQAVSPPVNFWNIVD